MVTVSQRSYVRGSEMVRPCRGGSPWKVLVSLEVCPLGTSSSPSHPNYETHISAMMCLHGPKAAWPTKYIQTALKLDPNKLFLCVNCLKYFINNNKSLPNRSKMENIKRLTKIYFIKQLNLLSTKLNLSYLKCNV